MVAAIMSLSNNKSMYAVRAMLLSIALLCIPHWALAATAHLDRPVMREGESVQLVIEGNDGEPDFSVLEDDFEILSSSKSSHVNIINGRMDARTRWIVTLIPTRDGDLTLPAIRVGNEETKPIPIRVLKSADPNGQSGAADVFLEVNTNTSEPYVQGQVVYSIRLFSVSEIREGGLSSPAVQNAVIERLGEDVHYQSKRNGRDYQVTERRFAIFPQRNGRIEIGPTVFSGQLLQRSGGVNPFADPFSGFFGQPTSRPVRMRSQGITLNVRPKPADAGNPWLPAQNLTLRETWSPANPQFRVGESITRTIRMEAMGLTGSQLPPIKMAETNGIKTYADQPVVASTPTPEGVTGVRDDKFAIVPARPGSIDLPEIRIDWWDTANGTLQTAIVPSRSIEVLPAAELAPAVPTRQPEIAPPKQVADAPSEVPGATVDAGLWPWIAAFAALGWLMTAAVWFARTRRKTSIGMATQDKASPTKAQLEPLKQRVRTACQRGDAQAVKSALLEWAQVAWPERSVTNLAEFAEQLGSESLRDPFAQLNTILYAKHPGHWESMTFWDAVGPLLQAPTHKTASAAPALPPLHPRTV